MPMTSSLSAARSLRSALRSGISSRHGPHQVAQKLMMSGCPFQLMRLRLVPLRSGRVTSGSVSGTVGAGPSCSWLTWPGASACTVAGSVAGVTELRPFSTR